MPVKTEKDERAALQRVIDSLSNVEEDARARIINCAATFFDIGLSQVRVSNSQHKSGDIAGSRDLRDPVFSERTDLSPKEFLLQKEPETDIERVACIGYYLTHYRDTPEFKTIDISKLNTEAAQIKFSNTAHSVSNCVQRGFLTSASRGYKQLTAIGEQYVDALPDRERVAEVGARLRTRRKNNGKRKTSGTSNKGA